MVNLPARGLTAAGREKEAERCKCRQRALGGLGSIDKKPSV